MTRCMIQIRIIVSSAANSTSVKKCPPAAMRETEITTVKIAAPAKAAIRHCGGASMAGADIQAAEAASPETKEQLRSQLPCGFHQST